MMRGEGENLGAPYCDFRAPRKPGGFPARIPPPLRAAGTEPRPVGEEERREAQARGPPKPVKSIEM